MSTAEHIPALPLLAWRDRRRSLPEAVDRRPGQFLIVGDGVDHRLLPIEGDVLRIGRGPSVDLPLDDPTVSRRHATLLRHDGVLELRDDRSTNGTYVNGRRVDSAHLADGDVVSFGRVTVAISDATPATAHTA